LEYIRAQNWLINDAVLTFTIDRDKMSGTMADPDHLEPNRLYLYDLTNRRPLIDYSSDVTTNSANPKLSKYIHGGIIERDGDKRGIQYRFRITNHLRNLVRTDVDSTNVRLGLVVTESIGNVTNAYRESAVPASIDRVPAASVSNRLGTVLYGSNVSGDDAAKRVKLTIYYTKKKTD
jgi:hypothetical protein